MMCQDTALLWVAGFCIRVTRVENGIDLPPLPDSADTVSLHLTGTPVPERLIPTTPCVFHSGDVWSMHRTPESVFISLSAQDAPRVPARSARFSPDFLRGVIHMPPGPQAGDSRTPDAAHALAFPLRELLMVCLLSQGRGVMVHAAGVAHSGRGYLFPGQSGRGKSTMARLWKDAGRVVHDDRIILRRRKGEVRMYPPVPSPRQGAHTGEDGAPLAGVFFLRHHLAHEATPVRGARAASMLFARAFAPYWDTEGMGFTLEFCADVVQSIPCFDLGFTPTPGVRDVIQCVM